MKILISGSSNGIGRSVSLFFLEKGFDVIGMDKLPSTIKNEKYTHYEIDLKQKDKLPDLNDIDIIFANAGLQNSEDDIDNNLKATISFIEKYMNSKCLKSILFNASASARSGFEFPCYVASKAGVVGYMKNVASRLAKRGITVNSISLGGVLTDSNKNVIHDKVSWEKIMEVTPLKKWMSLDEVNEWVYFLSVTNKSLTGQDILIDNGEYNLNNTFVWKE